MKVIRVRQPFDRQASICGVVYCAIAIVDRYGFLRLVSAEGERGILTETNTNLEDQEKMIILNQRRVHTSNRNHNPHWESIAAFTRAPGPESRFESGSQYTWERWSESGFESTLPPCKHNQSGSGSGSESPCKRCLCGLSLDLNPVCFHVNVNATNLDQDLDQNPHVNGGLKSTSSTTTLAPRFLEAKNPFRA